MKIVVTQCSCWAIRTSWTATSAATHLTHPLSLLPFHLLMSQHEILFTFFFLVTSRRRLGGHRFCWVVAHDVYVQIFKLKTACFFASYWNDGSFTVNGAACFCLQIKTGLWKIARITSGVFCFRMDFPFYYFGTFLGSLFGLYIHTLPIKPAASHSGNSSSTMLVSTKQQ